MNILHADAHSGIFSKHELMPCHGEILHQIIIAMMTNFLKVISQARNGTLAPAFLPEIL